MALAQAAGATRATAKGDERRMDDRRAGRQDRSLALTPVLHASSASVRACAWSTAVLPSTTLNPRRQAVAGQPEAGPATM